jgi:hypothetical protein
VTTEERTMEMTGDTRVLSVEVFLAESAEETTAKATVDLGGRHVGGWGRARRNPGDPSVRRIGEELATARALSDLAHGLLDMAAHDIETFEHQPVHVHG